MPKVLVNYYSHSALAQTFIRNICAGIIYINLFDIVYISFVSEIYEFVLQIALLFYPTHSLYVT